jgi:hypothetical protein
MSDAAAADARTRFSESAVVAQYEALYERTIQETSRSAGHDLSGAPLSSFSTTS